MKNDWFNRFEHKFVNEFPDGRHAFELFREGWKFKFEDMDVDGIGSYILTHLGIPRRCAEHFGDMSDFDCLELGPGEGYLSYGLEAAGVRFNTAIEGNIDAFIKCLIMKNALDLKTKYILGDFTKYIADTEHRWDLIFASGVLYHQVDPVGFLKRCAEKTKFFYLWSIFYDQDAVSRDTFERASFERGEAEHVTFGDLSVTYHRRPYHESLLSRNLYSGGLNSYASWLSYEDLRKTLEWLDFEILHELKDNRLSMPAVNIFARTR